MQLDDKTAIVTGGASGLGGATAAALVEGGCSVTILDIDQEKGAAHAAALGDRARYVRTDVTDEASVTAAISSVLETEGALHICVNCAGIGPPAKTVGRDGPHPLGLFEKVVRINLIGTFNVARLAAHAMQSNDPDNGERGVIINTASVAAFEGQIGQVAYAASKGGIVGMTIPMARDLARDGIRVNTIAPGIFDTPLLAGLPDNVREALGQMVLNPQRLGQPAEFARLAVFLIESPYLNAETVRIDGGIRMQPR
ncbi:MAG: 3-hydroxyacyl-CoA dehydrogenase [Gemmatimonadota bacterium]|nr:3-hydroxyacyl-CoA dehydrogenase [Gemmatimonadota bacterium]